MLLISADAASSMNFTAPRLKSKEQVDLSESSSLLTSLNLPRKVSCC